MKPTETFPIVFLFFFWMGKGISKKRFHACRFLPGLRTASQTPELVTVR